jgi:hypothetical protein
MGERFFRFIVFTIFICCLLAFLGFEESCVYAGDSTGSIIIPEKCYTNADCKEGYFCSKLVGACDEIGVCVERPQACITITLYDPVCGCDGVTYGNSCDAAWAGISVNYPGECGSCAITCDVNYDGKCDVSDVILVLRIALKLDPGELPACFDINKDGNVDITDVILILRMALGLDR